MMVDIGRLEDLCVCPAGVEISYHSIWADQKNSVKNCGGFTCFSTFEFTLTQRSSPWYQRVIPVTVSGFSRFSSSHVPLKPTRCGRKGCSRPRREIPGFFPGIGRAKDGNKVGRVDKFRMVFQTYHIAATSKSLQTSWCFK